MLLGVGLFVVAGGVYGAGLLMNHSDVPKGTTVLGVDIGGGTRDDGRHQARLHPRQACRPRRCGSPSTARRRPSRPDKAGLSLDSQATVRRRGRQ